MQFDDMLEEALINKEQLMRVSPLFHITVHFQMETSSYILKEVTCMKSLLFFSDKQCGVINCCFVRIFLYNSSLSFLSFQ